MDVLSTDPKETRAAEQKEDRTKGKAVSSKDDAPQAGGGEGGGESGGIC